VPGAFEKRTSAGGIRYVYHIQGTDGPVAQVVSDGSQATVQYLLTDRLGTI
jgi:hypothetical protein